MKWFLFFFWSIVLLHWLFLPNIDVNRKWALKKRLTFKNRRNVLTKQNTDHLSLCSYSNLIHPAAKQRLVRFSCPSHIKNFGQYRNRGSGCYRFNTLGVIKKLSSSPQAPQKSFEKRRILFVYLAEPGLFPPLIFIFITR